MSGKVYSMEESGGKSLLKAYEAAPLAKQGGGGGCKVGDLCD
jgi:hypothetical protein